MISEVDIRDWDKADLQPLQKASEILFSDGYELISIDLKILYKNLELIREKQIKAAQRQIPALFQPLVEAVNRGE